MLWEKVIMTRLQEEYNAVVNKYLLLFKRKQEIDFEGWVGDFVGEIATFGDMFFNFDDIRLDIDTDQPKDQIIDWYWETIENNPDYPESKEKLINYKSWCKGLRYGNNNS